MENTNENAMQQMMQQMVAFFQQQQAMQQRMNLEDRMRKARQSVIEKLDRFDGRDVSKYCHAYEQAMEDNGIGDVDAIEGFHLAVTPQLRGRIGELQVQHRVSWRNFKAALKAEYFLEDSQRVTKQTFHKWVQIKNKGLTSRELLREFEKKFDQLSTGEQQSLMNEKVELFVQAADSRLQKSLVQLLEDVDGELGLTNDWDAVPAAINLLVKRQKRIDKSIVEDFHEDSKDIEKVAEKAKAPLPPKLEDSNMEDLIKGIQELNLNLKTVRVERSTPPSTSSSQRPLESRPERCIWCDSTSHIRRDCEEFNDAFSKNVVFWKDRKIHLTQTGQLIRTNFGRGGMKKIVEEMSSITSTYAMQVYKDENEEEVKTSRNLWPHALRTAEAGKVTSVTLRQAGDSIRETTGWIDPVDSLSVYAYIAKSQANEALVEEKRKREEEAPETSRRNTRANTRNDGERVQKSAPAPEVQMEDAPKDKKQGRPRGPSYKLRSDIELATDLKKVFEERILNSKVEMTLGDILGIAKREFHEEIIDIIKRKRHVPVEQESNPSNSQNVHHEELEDLDEHMTNVVISEAKHTHFNDDDESEEVPRSHFSRSHWARATTETMVKIGDFEEPILALVDHGSEINLMSKALYQKGKWPIDLDHGWRIRAANTQPGYLYGACANVKVTIGDVSDQQNIFVQDHSSYPLILGQPYIVALRMETKVLDDGSAYARIRSKDGFSRCAIIKQYYDGAKKGEFSQGVFSSGFIGLKSEGSYSYRKFKDLQNNMGLCR